MIRDEADNSSTDVADVHQLSLVARCCCISVALLMQLFRLRATRHFIGRQGIKRERCLSDEERT